MQKSLLIHIHVAADRLMLGILWAMFAFALVISGVRGTTMIALLVGAPAVLAGTALVLTAPGAWLTRMLMAVLTMVFAALHIHQLAGQTELHFGIFVLLAFLLCYRDWRVIVAAATTIAVHHASFNALQQMGMPTLCLTEPSWSIIAVHAGYVVAESAVLCYLSVLLRREAVQAAELTGIVRTFAQGVDGRLDLCEREAPASSRAGQALQNGMRTLHGAIVTVVDGVRRMHEAIAQIADASGASAARTDAQARTLRSAAQETQQLTTTVNANRDSADAANALAAAAASTAHRGGSVVMRVVETMDRINGSSSRIVDIIDTIDGIAFQTNILALNAAVEAARAGEQGRGFAVVAAEVRNLAQRSATASREIKTMIEASVAEIEGGHRLAGEAGQTMSEIVKAITEVHGIMAGIADASRAQATQIGGLHAMLEDMQAAAADCSGLAAEATESAQRLQSDADTLTLAVGQFTTDR